MYSELEPTAQMGPFSLPLKRQRSARMHVIASVKAGMRHIKVESGLEAKAVFYYEGDPTVLEICEQPIRLPVPRTGSSHTTLDLAIRRQDKTTYLEVKPEKKLVQRENGELAPANWDRIQRWSLDNGFDVDFITDTELRKHKYHIHNWRAMLPYVWMRGKHPEPTLSIEIYEIINQIPGVTTEEVTNQITFSRLERVYFEVTSLLHRGSIESNFDTRIFSPLSPLKRRSNHSNDEDS